MLMKPSFPVEQEEERPLDRISPVITVSNWHEDGRGDQHVTLCAGGAFSLECILLPSISEENLPS